MALFLYENVVLLANPGICSSGGVGGLGLSNPLVLPQGWAAGSCLAVGRGAVSCRALALGQLCTSEKCFALQAVLW